jgi:diguanylate cyclase (GGDEF)-like protein
MAMHDGLTGLPNRRLVLDRIGQALEEQRREGSAVAVLYMDLDDFKAVNDSHGHAAGDQLLVTVGHRLAGSVRAIDTVGRIGGDEFVIVAVLSDGVGASSIARHIEDALREPITIGDDIVVHVDASVGMVLSEPDDPRSATELLSGADEAMYELKRRRRLRIVN